MSRIFSSDDVLRYRLANASVGYQIFMLVLCVYSLGILAFQAAKPTDPATVIILEYADFAVCTVFLMDFLVSLFRAENRLKYLVTWGWLDLLSSIPTMDLARWGRAARILRVFRVLRGLRATKLLANLLVKDRAKNTALAAALLAVVTLTFGSIAILHFESGSDANITTADNALWWAFATIATVGYGDLYPTTSEGRFVAALLMATGVGLAGTFAGVLASWFVGEDDNTAAEIAALREEIRRLREAVHR